MSLCDVSIIQCSFNTKGTIIMADGNSMTDGQPTQKTSTSHIMDPLGAGAFGVQITTTDIVGGMGNVQSVQLTAPDGTSIFAEHHQIGMLPAAMPGQDVPPGEVKAKP
jgi:hypothetical protein